jgi:NDP-sugar pyrophosphorylase family protein
MSKRSIVVLAAGMGSRYGGVKQVEPVGPSGEFLSEYGIYDAIKCGFERVIFIIKREHLDIFKNHICANFKDKIEVCFAFQDLDNIPKDVKMPEGRTKAWGTTQALLCAKPYIDGSFVMINADDFNGFDSYKKVADFFDNNDNEKEYITINYPLNVTVSDNGTVKRGICLANNSIVENIIESEISYENNGFIAHPLDGSESFSISKTQPVTVNFFGLKPSIFKYLETDFDKFMHGNINSDCECLMPDTLKRLIKSGEIKMHEGVSNAVWFGMTYKEDLPVVKESIKKLIYDGDYPNNLWG